MISIILKLSPIFALAFMVVFGDFCFLFPFCFCFIRLFQSIQINVWFSVTFLKICFISCLPFLGFCRSYACGHGSEVIVRENFG